jgi:hypothetical protein
VANHSHICKVLSAGFGNDRLGAAGVWVGLIMLEIKSHRSKRPFALLLPHWNAMQRTTVLLIGDFSALHSLKS